MTLLSHYTRRIGLEGIARTKTFWATNFLDLLDPLEYFYAWSILQRDAIEEVLKQLPDDIKLPGQDLDQVTANLITEYRNRLRQTDGFGHLYVVSFARGCTENQNQRDIHWERFTSDEGYCLQFEQGDLEHFLRLDSWKTNYGVAGLHEVQYGVNRATRTYKELLFQLTQSLLAQLKRARNEERIQLEYEKIWAESTLVRKLLEFCAIHKSPSFENEREMRLFCYPSSQSEARPFTGIADAKNIRMTQEGRRYIVIGEHWTPGIVPRRIIIGRKADRDVSAVLAHYARPPEVYYEDPLLV